MKIGLLTYYHDMNCGTILQAYAGLQALKKTYPKDDVSIIPLHAIKMPFRPYFHDATLLMILRDLRRVFGNNRIIKNELGVPRSHEIIEVEKGVKFISDYKCDKIYVGADTLLELNRTKPTDYDGLSYYWLSDTIKAKKYMLAASCGNEDYNKLSEKQKEDMRRVLSSYSGFGVRDDNTENLLAHFVDRKLIQRVPDPTYTLTVNYSYIDKYLADRHLDIAENSILIHSSKEDTWVPKLADSLRKQGYKIYSLAPAKWADVCIFNINAFEQLGLYRYFRLVITNRFHDSIFCMKNGTPMLLYKPGRDQDSTTGESKFSSLIKQAGLYPLNLLEERVITADSVLERVECSINNFYKHVAEISTFLTEQEKAYWDYLNLTKN